jgi:hypothetical protein
VKQIFEALRANPTFVQHKSYQDPNAEKLISSYVALHGEQSAPYGWRWHELGLYMRSDSDSGLDILCLGFPEQLQTSICSALEDGVQGLEASDPWAIISVILREILVLYTDSVWSLRNHICKCETV